MNKQFRPHAFRFNHSQEWWREMSLELKMRDRFEIMKAFSYWVMRTYQPFKVQNPLVGIVKTPEKKTDSRRFAFGFEAIFLDACNVHFIWYGEGINDSDDEEDVFVVSDGYFFTPKNWSFCIPIAVQLSFAHNVVGHTSSWIKLHSSSLWFAIM